MVLLRWVEPEVEIGRFQDCRHPIMQGGDGGIGGAGEDDAGFECL